MRLTLDECALFLDVDGTLAQIEDNPTRVGPDRRRNRLMRHLHDALGGRLALISGRTIADIDRIFEGSVDSVAGVHGLERRSAHRVRYCTTTPRIAPAAEKAARYIAARPGLILEDKGVSLALHYRQNPDLGAEAIAFAEELAAAHALDLLHGKMVVEVRAPGPSKGDAIRAFLAEPPFAKARPLYLGDDLTDEAAFVAASEQGGAGVLVGPARRSAARFRLESPVAALDWLEASLERRAFQLEDLSWAA